MKKASVKRCSECGAELKVGPTRCPLCGADAETKVSRPAAPPDVDSYHSNVRQLREQLRKLRDDHPEAV